MFVQVSCKYEKSRLTLGKIPLHIQKDFFYGKNKKILELLEEFYLTELRKEVQQYIL